MSNHAVHQCAFMILCLVTLLGPDLVQAQTPQGGEPPTPISVSGRVIEDDQPEGWTSSPPDARSIIQHILGWLSLGERGWCDVREGDGSDRDESRES